MITFLKVTLSKETRKSKERITRYCDNDQKSYNNLFKFTKVLSIVLHAQHTKERIQFTMFPQCEASVCQAKLVHSFCNTDYASIVTSHAVELIGQEWLFTAMHHLKHRRMRKESLGSYYDAMKPQW